MRSCACLVRGHERLGALTENTSHATVVIDYAAVEQLADDLHAQAVALQAKLDQLSAGWHQMLGASSGDAMTAFSFRAGDSHVEQLAGIEKLEAASVWLRKHSDNMRQIDDDCAARLAILGPDGGSQGQVRS